MEGVLAVEERRPAPVTIYAISYYLSHVSVVLAVLAKMKRGCIIIIIIIIMIIIMMMIVEKQ